jgi:hypothetical protein
MSSDPTRDHVRYGDLLAAPLSFWFGCCSGLAMSGFEITHLVAGGAFVDHLLSPRVFGHGARYHLMKYLHLSEFSLAIILLFARPIFWRDRRILVAYGIISISAATIFAGFEGTSYNMFQDTVVFLAVASGVILHELRGCITSEAAATALAAKFTLKRCAAPPHPGRSWSGARRLLRKSIVRAACWKLTAEPKGPFWPKRSLFRG